MIIAMNVDDILLDKREIDNFRRAILFQSHLICIFTPVSLHHKNMFINVEKPCYSFPIVKYFSVLFLLNADCS